MSHFAFALLSLCCRFALPISHKTFSSKARHAAVVIRDGKLECSLAAHVAQLEAEASSVNPLDCGFLLPTAGASLASSALGGKLQKGT